MRVLVNGDTVEVAVKATVAEAVGTIPRLPKGAGVAVAVNGEVVPRGEWDSTPLREDDRIEVLSAIGGG